MIPGNQINSAHLAGFGGSGSILARMMDPLDKIDSGYGGLIVVPILGVGALVGLITLLKAKNKKLVKGVTGAAVGYYAAYGAVVARDYIQRSKSRERAEKSNQVRSNPAFIAETEELKKLPPEEQQAARRALLDRWGI